MRILLVKTSSLGDVIHNLPAVTDMAAAFPDARIDWVVEENFAEIPALHPAVNRVLPVAIRRWRRRLLNPATWQEIRKFRHALREYTYDAIVDTQGLLKSALITSQAVGERMGYAAESAREPIAARFYHSHTAIPRGLQAVTRNRWLAGGSLGYLIPAGFDGTPDYGIQAPPLQSDWLANAPYAVFLHGTSRHDKEWAEENWILLGKHLAEAGIQVVLPWGSAKERQRSESIAKALPNACVPPPLSLRDAASLLAGACAVVGVDTGLSHLAAALKRPVLAIYCGSDPGLTGLVAAGGFARNLGMRGQPPDVYAVISALQEAAIL